MYCPNCGAYNEASYNNCTSCGKYIGDINKEAAQKTENAETKPLGSEEEKNNGGFFSEYEKHSAAGESFADTNDFAKNEAWQQASYSNQGSSAQDFSKASKKRSIYTQYTKLPRDYFILSIICTLLGSISFGIAALVFSVMTKAANNEENYKRAATYSLSAKRFCIISAIIGVVKYVFIWFLISFMFGLRRYLFFQMW